MTLSAVMVDGFALSGASQGGQWTVTGLQGWYSGAQTLRNRQPKMQQAGSFPSMGVAADLPITVSGEAVFPDSVTAAKAALAFRAIGGVASAVPMSVTDEAGTLTAQVEQDGRSFDMVGEFEAAWSLQLMAPDPLFYGAQRFASATLATATPGAGRVWPRAWPTDWGIPAGVTPGAVSLLNAGTAAYWPTLRIDGPVTNPVVTLNETGDWIRYNGALTSSQWLDIDCGLRRVLLNGQVSVRNIVTFSGNWLAVPPGGASTSWVADDANPAAKLSIWSYEGAWS